MTIRISYQPYDGRQPFRDLDRDAIGEWEREDASSKAGDFPRWEQYALCCLCDDVILGYEKVHCEITGRTHWAGEGENTVSGHHVRVCPDCWRGVAQENMSKIPLRLFRKEKRKAKRRARGFKFD